MKIAIAGAGKLGLRITEILMGGDHSIVLIDENEELTKRLAASLDVTIVTGNATEASLLKSIGVEDVDYFITTTESDEENIVIGAMAAKLGAFKIIARVRDPEHDKQNELIKEVFGIDFIINPERSIAVEIYKYLIEKYSFHGGILLADMVAMLEITVDKMPELIGRPVSEIRDDLFRGGISLAAISKNGKIIILSKADEYTMEETDVLFVVGERRLIDNAFAEIVDNELYTDIQHVMIAGGGNVGYYLAQMLDEFGASVKIIEINMERCRYLAAHLQNVLVLNGDATSSELLDDENFHEMDAFVSATGFDEENLLLALLAKQAGIADVIAKVSRENFGDLIKSMGVDMVLSTVNISASQITRSIEDTMILSSQIIQGQAELLRILVEPGMWVEGKEIGNLELPQGLAIAAIQRGTIVILPDDKTKIVEGDKLVILCLLSESIDLEKLLKIKQGIFG